MSNYDETKLEAAGREGMQEASRKNEQSQIDKGKSEKASNLTKEDRPEGGRRSQSGTGGQNK